MREKTPPRILTIFLGLASLAIWSAIVWHVTLDGEAAPQLVRPAKSTPLNNVVAGDAALPGEAFNQRLSLLRNPFAAPGKGEEKTVRPPRTARDESPALPTVEYGGFIRGPDGLLALISQPGAAPRICLPGDTVFDMRVLRIDAQSLLLDYRGRRYSVSLQDMASGSGTDGEEDQP